MGVWILIIFVVFLIALPVVAIHFNRDKPGMSRSAFSIRIIGLFVVGIVLVALADIHEVMTFMVGLGTIVVAYFSYAFTVQRLNDAGWSVWLTPMQALPAINLLFTLALMIVPSKEQEAAMMET